jgi:hypothetical protein
VYGVEYKVAGGMYRGEPPVDFFKADWPEKMLRGGASGQPNMDDGLGYALAHLIGQVEHPLTGDLFGDPLTMLTLSSLPTQGARSRA